MDGLAVSMSVYHMHACLVSLEASRGFLELEVAVSWQNPSPLEEHYVLSIVEPSLQPLWAFLQFLVKDMVDTDQFCQLIKFKILVF